MLCWCCTFRSLSHDVPICQYVNAMLCRAVHAWEPRIAKCKLWKEKQCPYVSTCTSSVWPCGACSPGAMPCVSAPGQERCAPEACTALRLLCQAGTRMAGLPPGAVLKARESESPAAVLGHSDSPAGRAGAACAPPCGRGRAPRGRHKRVRLASGCGRGQRGFFGAVAPEWVDVAGISATPGAPPPPPPHEAWGGEGAAGMDT